MEQSWGESAELPGRHAAPRWTERGQLNEGIMFGELKVLLFVFVFEKRAW